MGDPFVIVTISQDKINTNAKPPRVSKAKRKRQMKYTISPVACGKEYAANPGEAPGIITIKIYEETKENIKLCNKVEKYLDENNIKYKGTDLKEWNSEEQRISIITYQIAGTMNIANIILKYFTEKIKFYARFQPNL